MAKSWDRGMGRASAMHDRLLTRVEKSMWTLPHEPKEAQPMPEPKRAWTPERWAHRIVKGTGK